MRFIISLIILTLIISYLILPLVASVRKIGKSEIKRIDNIYNKEDKRKYKNRNGED